ncbi:hypothetical protein ACE41H_15675 [Paenibacillus enshidis]|uniref:Uncharacterized protein n=1 Tax=Paenibacillus enshidis TaxID=1458439 RepID=A0ABV5AVG0_9BACL
MNNPLMEKLLEVLFELSNECEQSWEFNDWLSEQDIFARSIDEIILGMLNNKN